MPNKKISFPVSDEEHEQIKNLAKEERRTIKQLVLDAFDKLYPGWNMNQRKLKIEPTSKDK